jgi:Vitamin K-dependent gamma-carboxylase
LVLHVSFASQHLVHGANTVTPPKRQKRAAAGKREADVAAAVPRTRMPVPWFAPELLVRIELLRVLAPLAILGFLSSRVAYTEQWISEGGFCLPDLGTADAHESVYLPALSGAAAWWVSAALVLSGLLVIAGYKTRLSAGAFAALLVYVALADRLAAFTVSRISPMIALAICLSPAGTRFSVDAWLARRRAKSAAPEPPIEEMSGGVIRFLRAFLIVFYTASGICKARGDWLNHSGVLWTHLHDSYQTAFTLLLANTLPGFMWTVFQGMTLAFECLALLWLGWKRVRLVGLVFALGMHLLIGLMFGPVIWFSLLMTTVLLTCYLPDRTLERLTEKLALRTDP